MKCKHKSKKVSHSVNCPYPIRIMNTKKHRFQLTCPLCLKLGLQEVNIKATDTNITYHEYGWGRRIEGCLHFQWYLKCHCQKHYYFHLYEVAGISLVFCCFVVHSLYPGGPIESMGVRRDISNAMNFKLKNIEEINLQKIWQLKVDFGSPLVFQAAPLSSFQALI